MAEWTKAPVLQTGITVGSNPTRLTQKFKEGKL